MREGIKTVGLEEILAASSEPAVEEGHQALLIFTAGHTIYAVNAVDVERVTEARFVAPLPSPPPGVVGVSTVSGRMRLVVDPGALYGRAERRNSFVVLHGDSQLALAADRVHAVVTVPVDEPAMYDSQRVELLDPERLLGF
jgi:chemotaxis signal transduction protein